MEPKHPTVLSNTDVANPFLEDNVRDYGEVMNQCGGDKGCGASVIDKGKHIAWHQRNDHA